MGSRAWRPSIVVWCLALGWLGQVDGGPECESLIEEVIGGGLDSGLVGLYLKSTPWKGLVSRWGGGRGRHEASKGDSGILSGVQNKVRPASVCGTDAQVPSSQKLETLFRHGVFLGNTKMSSVKEQRLLWGEHQWPQSSRVRHARCDVSNPSCIPALLVRPRQSPRGGVDQSGWHSFSLLRPRVRLELLRVGSWYRFEWSGHFRMRLAIYRKALGSPQGVRKGVECTLEGSIRRRVSCFRLYPMPFHVFHKTSSLRF